MFKYSQVSCAAVIATAITLSTFNCAFAAKTAYDESAILEKEFALNRPMRHKFDKGQWQLEQGRAPMLSDLVHSYPLIGMTPQQVENLLGKGWHDSDSYIVGTSPCGVFGPMWLDLVYEEGRLQKYRLRLETRNPLMTQWVEKNPS